MWCLHAVCYCIRSSVSHFWDIIPVKTLTKPVFRPQGLQCCSDRWELQARCPNSHPGFSIDLSHTSTHKLSYSSIQICTILLFPSRVYWQANNTNLILIWIAIHVDLQLVAILQSLSAVMKKWWKGMDEFSCVIMIFSSNENLVLHHCETSSFVGCCFVILRVKETYKDRLKERWLCKTTERKARERRRGWKSEWWQAARVKEWHYQRMYFDFDCVLPWVTACVHHHSGCRMRNHSVSGPWQHIAVSLSLHLRGPAHSFSSVTFCQLPFLSFSFCQSLSLTVNLLIVWWLVKSESCQLGLTVELVCVLTGYVQTSTLILTNYLI